MVQVSRRALLARAGIGTGAGVFALLGATAAPALAAPSARSRQCAAGLRRQADAINWSTQWVNTPAAVLDKTTADLIREIRKQEQGHYSTLAPLLGATAPVDDDYVYVLPKGALRSPEHAASFARDYEQLLVGLVVGAAARTVDPDVAATLTSIVAADGQHLSALSVLAGGSPVVDGLPSPLDIIDAGDQISSSSPIRWAAMTRISLLRRAGGSLLVGNRAPDGLHGRSRRTPERAQAQMNVFAAASLNVAFPKFDGGQKYNFAGTDALAAQIRLGAPADLFAGASPDAPQALFRAGIVEQPVTFATNKLVLAVPAANPANINSIYDVERKGVRLLIGTPTVPIGAYTRQVLNNMGIANQVLPQVVSQEQNVTAIASKVALGTADAGFMYVTDALTVGDKVKVIPVPAWAQPPVRYQIAIVAQSANKADAAAFIKRLTSTAGRKLLVDSGFGVPKLPPAKKKRKK